MKKKIFFSTSQLNGAYKYIVEASKKNYESEHKLKLQYFFFKYKNYLSIRNFFFFIFYILKIVLLKKYLLNIKYKNLELSQFILSQTFKDHKSYKNKIYLYKNFIINFYKICCIINSLNNIPDGIKAVYVDHCMYLNGIIFQFFMQKKIWIYTNNLPRGLFKIKNEKSEKNYLFSDFIKFKKKYNLNKKKKLIVKRAISKNIFKNKYFYWIKKIKYKKINNNFNKITHVVYAHSFTDAQLVFGFDGFLNMKEWLIFTVKELAKNKNNKILIKSHPNFYNKFMGEQAIKDNEVFKSVKREIVKLNNIIIIDNPIKNLDILTILDKKKTILITHHGNVVLEGTFLDFKCISSTKTFWDCSKINLTNTWSNKSEYKELLNKNWHNLKYANQKDFYSVLYDYFINKYNLGGNKYYSTIIKKILKIKNSNEEYKLRRFGEFAKPDKIKYTRIIHEISKNIPSV